MPGIKRNYNVILHYLKKYGRATQVVPLVKIARDYPGDALKVQRWEKYIEHMSNLISSGELDLIDVYAKEKEINESLKRVKEFKETLDKKD